MFKFIYHYHTEQVSRRSRKREHFKKYLEKTLGDGGGGGERERAREEGERGGRGGGARERECVCEREGTHAH
jgi:hypothetical protein